jgi:hypothetical protein
MLSTTSLFYLISSAVYAAEASGLPEDEALERAVTAVGRADSSLSAVAARHMVAALLPDIGDLPSAA